MDQAGSGGARNRTGSRASSAGAMPVDLDVTEEGSVRPVVSVERRPRWPRLSADVLAVVFLGGCGGGLLRYAVGLAWDSANSGFPYEVLAVNLAGAFLLPVIVVTAADIRPSRYLRPLWGTGFCGALTTFSSVVVALARLLSSGHYAVAASYLAATVVGGLAAAALGVVLTRGVVVQRRRTGRQGRA